MRRDKKAMRRNNEKKTENKKTNSSRNQFHVRGRARTNKNCCNMKNVLNAVYTTALAHDHKRHGVARIALYLLNL